MIRHFADLPVDRLSRLGGVDPRLIFVMLDGLYRYYANEDPNETVNWRVTHGLRTEAEQAKLVREGKSQTLRSYHIEGRAVDMAAITHNWETAIWDVEHYRTLNKYVQQASDEVGLAVTWGGDWKNFVDACHWQIELITSGHDLQF